MAAKLAFLFLLAFIAHGQSDPLPRNEDEIREYAEFLEKSVNGKPIPPATPALEHLQNEWERSGKYEGDIVLTEEQREALVSDFIGDRNAIRDVNKLWPGGRVYYTIAPNYFNAIQVNAINRAIKSLESRTCVRFFKRTTQKNYILITGNNDGCHSSVGYVGGSQSLNLAPNNPGVGCFTHGTILHEILHGLGFYHMQSTFDRDDWVQIVWKKIVPGYEHNFNKYTAAQVTNLGENYDYGSVLHYSEYGFSVDGNKTIVPIRNTGGKIIGQRLDTSASDIRRVNRLYKCPRK